MSEFLKASRFETIFQFRATVLTMKYFTMTIIINNKLVNFHSTPTFNLGTKPTT